MSPKVSPETLVRQLPYGILRSLSKILDVPSPLRSNWEGLAALIPKRRGSTEMKYKQIDIMTFAQELQKPNGSPTQSVLSDWGTQNPTCLELVELLLHRDLYLIAAAEVVLPDYVKQKCYQQQETEKPGVGGGDDGGGGGDQAYDNISRQESLSPTTAQIDISSSASSSFIVTESKTQMENSETLSSPEICVELPSKSLELSPCTQISSLISSECCSESTDDSKDIAEKMSVLKIDVKDIKCIDVVDAASPTSDTRISVGHSKKTAQEMRKALMPVSQAQEFAYADLSRMTDTFNSGNIREKGNFIGEGAFGTVYYGETTDGKKLAIKKLKEGDSPLLSRITSQFKTEIEILSRCKHDNVVTLVGYSCDGESFCLVYDYMCNGSLQDRLMCDCGTEPLSWPVRVSIAKDVARGIKYLHDQKLIHRDIKSANVLLDADFVAKVGDFGLVRTGPDDGRSTIKTTQVFGTSAYMPKEAFSGTITTKLDTYSYGVVLLELMTGLPVIDEKRMCRDISTHIEDQCDSNEDFISIVDTSMNDWDVITVTELYEIALQCLEPGRKKRPEMAKILPRIEQL